jgi:hypothetical protein
LRLPTAGGDRDGTAATGRKTRPQGEKVIIAGSVSNDEAHQIWPDGWEEPKPYIRIVPQPV